MKRFEFYEIHGGCEKAHMEITSLERASEYYTRMVSRGLFLRVKVDGRQLLIHEADEMLLSGEKGAVWRWRNRE